MTNREGSVIGAYRLLRKIGGGGAGDVYLAEGPLGDAGSAQVAIKVLSGAASDPTARDIAGQAQAAGALRQSHILPLTGVVEQGDLLALVMAFAPGGSLGDTLRTRGPDGAKKLALPLAPGVVSRLVTQLGRALGAAHAAGLVHGDLKPANIFVRTSPNGAPLAAVSDFGQAVLTSAAAAVLGSGGTSVPRERRPWAAEQLAFAAPEQLRGERLPASDQYALAAIAYYLLTGKPPVVPDADSLPAAIAGASVTPPSLLRPELGGEADAVFLRALAKEPGRRFPSIEAFAKALDDSLAVAAAGGSGLTQQFASLAASNPHVRQPAGAPAGSAATGTPAASGVRVIDRSDTTRQPAKRSATPLSTPLPEDMPPGVNRPLAVISSVAVLIGLVACVLVFHVVQGSAALPKLNLAGHTIPGLPTQSTPTVNATATASALAATRQLAAATSGHPVFQDALNSAGGDSRWHPDGKSIFFSADGLHLNNASALSVLAADTPETPALDLSHVAARVDVTFVRGDTGGLAGMRFFVQPAGGRDAVYYCYVISPQGRYEVWVRHGDAGRYAWDSVLSGYSLALKTGMNVTNTISVLADSSRGDALLFANGQFVSRLNLGYQHAYSDAPTSGSVGLLVMYDNSEVAFAHFAVYGS